MSRGSDILLLFPELVSIGQAELQVYCDAWLQRPIAKIFGVAQILVDDDLLIHINLAEGDVKRIGNYAFMPIDELLGYIVDQHFAVPEDRLRLHASIRDARKRWRELSHKHELAIGRRGTLFLTCKNPACHAVMESDQQATEGQQIEYGPMDIVCLTCGRTYSYDGSDFQLKLPE